MCTECNCETAVCLFSVFGLWVCFEAPPSKPTLKQGVNSLSKVDRDQEDSKNTPTSTGEAGTHALPIQVQSLFIQPGVCGLVSS